MRKNHKKKPDLRKTLYVMAFIIAVLVIGAFIITSDIIFKPQTEEVLPAPDIGAICGNGLIELGETCSTCSLDVRCFSDEDCINSVCTREKDSIYPLTIPLILLTLITIFLISHKLIQRKEGEHGANVKRIEPLIRYISKSLRAGRKEPEIRINSFSVGWTERDTNSAFKVAKKRLKL
ncbi:hypothetical protein ACFLZZ_03875 [Nanoarchaeota archaeon]